jgi:hypothetical protein
LAQFSIRGHRWIECRAAFFRDARPGGDGAGGCGAKEGRCRHDLAELLETLAGGGFIARFRKWAGRITSRFA